MCGIAGIIDFRGVDPEPLERMALAQRHRGPDDAGVWHAGPAALAHRRLAIIDLTEAGRQPLCNEDGSIVLVMNGEIYDYRELRTDLERRGHRFQSSTDAEVLVHLYEEYGPDLVRYVTGMFAFAIWDGRRRRLFMARDHMGKKPLYYMLRGPLLAFASELKGLIEHPLVDRRVDRAALESYLLLGYVPGSASIFEAVRRLPPGCCACFEENGLRIDRYFLPEIEGGASRRAHPHERELEQELQERLTNAVRKRLLAADVEVGVLLSGGVDSSLIAALAAGEGRRIRTFCMGFADDAFDESEEAARVAQALGAEHHAMRFDPKTLLELIPELSRTFDEPFADASALPTLLLARCVSREVKCVLGGDGSDELFGGYPTLRAQRWAKHVPRFPGVGGLLRTASRFLPRHSGYYPPGYVLERFARGLHLPPPDRQALWTAYVGPQDLPGLFPGAPAWPAYVTEILEPLRDRPADIASRLMDQRLYLPDDILVKTDRASMAASLEVRAPFLDAGVVEFANRLPTSILAGKRLLRRVLRKTPASFAAHRRKHGFAVPMAEWLRGPLRDWADSVLQDAPRAGLDERTVRRMWTEHLQYRSNRWREIWCVLTLCEWAGRYRSYF